MSKPLCQLAERRITNPMQEAADRDYEAGKTLLELERRQDDVLSQLEDLDQKLTSILRGLGVTVSADEETGNPGIRLAVLSGDDGDEDGATENHLDAEPDNHPAVSRSESTLLEAASARRRAA